MAQILSKSEHQNVHKKRTINKYVCSRARKDTKSNIQFGLFCLSLLWQLAELITNQNFPFSQSSESFKLICPFDLTACKFHLQLLSPHFWFHFDFAAEKGKRKNRKNKTQQENTITEAYIAIVFWHFTNWLVNEQIDFCQAYLHLVWGNEAVQHEWMVASKSRSHKANQKLKQRFSHMSITVSMWV